MILLIYPWWIYHLVICHIAIENCHRNSWFTCWTWWLSIARYVKWPDDLGQFVRSSMARSSPWTHMFCICRIAHTYFTRHKHISLNKTLYTRYIYNYIYISCSNIISIVEEALQGSKDLLMIPCTIQEMLSMALIGLTLRTTHWLVIVVCDCGSKPMFFFGGYR